MLGDALRASPNYELTYMAHRKVNSPKHLKNGDIFFETPPNNCMNMLFFLILFLHILLIHDVEASENIKIQLSGDI